MPLHPDRIRPVGGELYGYVFKNARTGIERQLFWNLLIDCEPIPLGDDAWECSVLCDWLRWPVRRWPELDGVTLGEVSDPYGVEGSFYLSEHHELVVEALELRRIGPAPRFSVQISGRFDLRGFGEHDADDISLSLRAEVDFTGILLTPDNFFPKPSTPEQASALVSELIDLGDLREPIRDGSKFVFAPKAARAA